MMIIRISIISLLATLSFFTTAQEKTTTIGGHVYMHISEPVYSYNTTVLSEATVRYLTYFEQAKPSISAKFLLEKRLKEQTYLRIGLGYKNFGVLRDYSIVEFSTDPRYALILGLDLPELFTYYHIISTVHNAELSLELKQKLTERIYCLGGFSGLIRVALSQKSVVFNDKQVVQRSFGYTNKKNSNVINCSGNIGFGYEFVQKENYSLFAEPYGQFNLFGVNKESSLDRNYLSAGLAIGASF